MTTRCLSVVFVLLWHTALHASSGVDDFMRSIGKIHVVFAVILTIFVGLIILLVWMERRLSRIEKQLKSS